MISILMAVKTGAQYFDEAFASVLAQKHIDWELIVGVNGLPANSDVYWHIQRAAPSAGHRYVVLDMPGCRNKPEALNRMMAMIRGSHVAILDVDDVWHPHKLARQLPYLDDYAVVGTMGEYIGNVTGSIDVPTGPISFADMMQKNCLLNSSVVMKRECAKWAETNDLDDYPLWLELASAGVFMMNVGGEPLVQIRCHGDQYFSKHDNSEAIRAQYRNKQ